MNHHASAAKRSILFMSVVAMVFTGTPASSLVLIEDGRARCIIVVPREDEGVLEAAVDLQDHLRKMSGAHVPLVHDPNKVDADQDVGIYIDAPPLEAPGRGRMIDREALWPDGYVIEVVEFDGRTCLFLSSPRSEGLSHAVYGLLEDYLGCHWFTPGEIGVYIPRRRTVELDIPGNFEMVKPDFEKRVPWYNGNAFLKITREENRHYQMWRRRNRTGDSLGDAGHGWKYVFKQNLLDAVDEDGDGVSDLAPFFSGRRHPKLGICMSHPKAAEIASDWFIRFFNGRPEFDYFSFAQSDSPSWCRCDRCLSLASNDGARMLLMSNRVAEKLAEVHPHKRITIMAYKETLEPPQEMIRAHPNLIPVIVTLGDNQVGPKPENADFRRQVERWMTMLPLAWSRDYVGAMNGPWPLFKALQKNHDFYQSVGYTGVMNEYLSRNLGTDVHMWLNFQLAWDGSRRVKDLLAIFYPAYFGAAADDMRGIYERMEDHMMGLGGPAALIDAPQYYPVDLLEESLATIARARMKVSDDATIHARLERDENCLKATLLWVRYQSALARANDQRRDQDRAAAVTACRAYLAFVTALEGKLTMGGKARTLAEWMLESLTGPGTTFTKRGLHHHWDNFDYGGKAFLARTLTGFHFGKYGLYLKPGATGELIYDFRATGDLRFKEVYLPGGPGGFDLAIDMALPPGGRNSIEVSLDEGRTWTTAYENFQNPGDVVKFDLTRHVGGSRRFLLKFRVENRDREILALDRLTVMADVE